MEDIGLANFQERDHKVEPWDDGISARHQKNNKR